MPPGTTGAAIIFGGRSPIAIELSRALSREMKVFLVTRSLDDEITRLFQNYPNIELIAGDLSVRGEPRRIINEIYDLGVEPSSVAFLQKYIPGAEPKLEEHYAVELWSIAECLEEFSLRKASGSSLNAIITSSPASSAVLFDQDVSYHVVKAGQEALTRFYGARLARKGIFTNAVRIGSIVIKPRSEGYWKSVPEVISGIRELAPTGEVLDSYEVGHHLARILSHGISGVSGQVLTIDGGFSLLDAGQVARQALELSGSD